MGRTLFKGLALSIVTLLGPAIWAQDRNSESGLIGTDGAHSAYDSETIDPLGGNLHYSIPLYRSRQGDHFEFNLSLMYDSKVWNDGDFNYPSQPGTAFHTLVPLNALGLGWRLNLPYVEIASHSTETGTLEKYYQFNGPDGGRHRLFRKDNMQGGSCVQGFYYAYDGSGIKARDNGNLTWTVWTPDGVRYELGRMTVHGVPGFARLIWHRFNVTSIEGPVPKNGGPTRPRIVVTWGQGFTAQCPVSIQDDFGRIVSLTCSWDQSAEDGSVRARIDEIRVPAPHGETLVWGFAYSYNQLDDPFDCEEGACAYKEDVPLLRYLYAASTTYNPVSGYEYAFTYEDHGRNFGELRTVDLPGYVGKRVYAYDTGYSIWRKDYPISFEGASGGQFAYLPIRGVRWKEVTANPLSVWRWEWERFNDPQCSETTPQYCYNHTTRVEVKGPYVTADPSQASVTVLEYKATKASEENPLPLDGTLSAVKVYAGSPDPSRLLRTTSYQYAFDVPQAGNCGADSAFSKNHDADNVRTTSTTTVMEDDGKTPHDVRVVENADWFMVTENFGRFRETREYLADGTTLYRKSQVQIQLTAGQLANWVLSPIQWSRTLNASGTVLQEMHMSTDSYGRTTETRRLFTPGVSPGSFSPNDVIQSFSYDPPTGNLSRTVTSIPAQPEAFGQSVLEWEFGHPSKTQGDGVDWYTLDVDRDPNTGLPVVRRDPWGSGTAWTYDLLGRTVSVQPIAGSSEPPVTITHLLPDQTRVTVGVAGTPESLAQMIFRDGLGRMSGESIQTYDDQGNDLWVTHSLDMDPFGNLLAETEWLPLNDPNIRWTIYERQGPYEGVVARDPLFRVRRVVSPDGSIQTFDYQGLVTQATVHGIQSGTVASPTLVNATTTKERDIFGRVLRITPPTNEAAEIQNSYDELDRVLQRTANGNQPRTWLYDRLGRVLVENEPERGKRWFGSHSGDVVQADGYNALGKAIRFENAAGYAANPPYHYKSTYDSIGRLLKVEKETQEVSPTRTKIAEYVYDLPDHGVAAGSGYSHRGRLGRSMGYDDAGIAFTQSDYYFTETYGRLDRQVTAFDPWDGVTGNLGQAGSGDTPRSTYYAYDALGFVSSLTYPRTGAPGGFESMALTLQRKHGLVNWMGTNRAWNMINSARYSYSRGLKEWVAGNGVKTQLTPDDYDNERVREIKVLNTASSVLWNTGIYTYDGAGNIKSIGSDIFTYDLAGRLKEARLQSSSGTTLYWEAFAYDPFGNMTSRSRSIDGGMPEGVNYGLDPTTNRITSVNQGSAWSYREDGALRSDGSMDFAYDNAARLTQIQMGGMQIGSYGYDAAGLRVYRKENHGKEIFYFRDLDGAVLSQFSRPAGTTLQPTWDRDFVYLGSLHLSMIEEAVPSAVSWRTSASTQSAISLEWHPASETDVYGYLVYRKGPGETSFTPLYAGSSPVTTSGTTYSDTNVVSGATYHYKVVAIDTAGNQGGESVERQVTPGDSVPPAAPTYLTASAGNAVVHLTWASPSPDPPDHAGYFVYRRLGSGSYGAPLNFYPVTGFRNYTDLSVSNGTTYYYVVKAVDTAGLLSDASEEVSARPSSRQIGFGTVSPSWEDASPEERLASYQDSPEFSFRAPYSIVGDLLGESFYFLHSDHLGSVRLITGEAGTVVTSHKFFSFGEEMQPMRSMNPIRFAGYERDGESLMDYVKARFYSPGVGRWLTSDPLGYGYGYAANSPINYADPSGLMSCPKDGGTPTNPCTEDKEVVEGSWDPWPERTEREYLNEYCPACLTAPEGRTITARGGVGISANIFRALVQLPEGAKEVGCLALNYALSLPWHVSIVGPRNGPLAVDFTWVPKTGQLYGAIGAGFTAPGRMSLNVGPFTHGEGDLHSIMTGWTFGFNVQASPTVGVQTAFNSEGHVEGPSFLSPGGSVTATYGAGGQLIRPVTGCKE